MLYYLKFQYIRPSTSTTLQLHFKAKSMPIIRTSFEVSAAERPHAQPVAGVGGRPAVLHPHVQGRDETRVEEKLGHIIMEYFDTVFSLFNNRTMKHFTM